MQMKFCLFVHLQSTRTRCGAQSDNVVCVDMVAAGRRRSNGLSTNWGLYEQQPLWQRPAEH